MFFPLTAMYAGLLGLMLIVLSALVSRQRRRAKVSIGFGGDSGLERASRAQGNFVEYVPLGLILLMLLEPEVSRSWVIHVLGSMLLAGRLLHAIGMHPRGALIHGRFWGTGLTWMMIVAASLLNLWHQL